MSKVFKLSRFPNIYSWCMNLIVAFGGLGILKKGKEKWLQL